MSEYKMVDLNFDEDNFVYSELHQTKRFRGFRLQRNYEYEREQTNETQDEWRKRIAEEMEYIFNTQKIEYMAYIFHDKDFLEDGSPKPLHVHVDVRFENARMMPSIAKLFRVSRSSNIENIKSYVDSARYLIHVSEKAINEQKHIYQVDEVVCFNCNMKEMMRREGEAEKRTEGLNDFVATLGRQIREGEITKDDAEKEIVLNYGEADWRKVRQSFDIDEEEYLAKLGKKAMIDGLNRTLVYGSGLGGIGKSSTMRLVSQRFIDSRGVHKVSVGGRDLTFDFAGTYNGEKVTIADDLDSSYFHYRDFFGMFDPHEYAPSKSRNKDKHWLAEKCFVTNNIPLGEWVFNLIYYSNKDMQRPTSEKTLSMNAIPMIWQALRRFAFWLEFHEDKIVIKKPTSNKIIDGVEVAREVEKGYQVITPDTMNYYYFEDYAEITFDNLFDEQEEVADKIAEIINQFEHN